MISLIIDTSTPWSLIILAKDGVILTQAPAIESCKLSKFLLSSIQTLLQGQVPIFIAIGVGPGTCTGTRVGAITAQSLAYGWKIPLISFSSLLLAHPEKIALLTYEKYLKEEFCQQIDLVYISPQP